MIMNIDFKLSKELEIILRAAVSNQGLTVSQFILDLVCGGIDIDT